MKSYKFFIAFLVLLSLEACVQYEQKLTAGDPSVFSSTSTGVNLLPALDTNCGGSNCIQ